MKKDSGELPIIGVNTYLAEKAQEEESEIELSRSSAQEKQEQIDRLKDFQNRNRDKAEEALQRLSEAALTGNNIFEELLRTVNYCSLGQIPTDSMKWGGGIGGMSE